MTISRRHHYIPRFLIDNFTDLDKKVWVYDKEEGKIQNRVLSQYSLNGIETILM